jgi:hypothetical protein
LPEIVGFKLKGMVMKIRVLALTVALMLPVSSQAAEPFTFAVSVNSNPYVSAGYSSVESLILAAETGSLQALVPSYQSTDAANMMIGFRGLDISTSFQSGLNELSLNIPALGISQLFMGASRDASANLMNDYFKSAGLLEQIASYLAAHSPVDPIAGNPSSLMSSLVANDFNQTFNAEFSNIASPGEVATQSGQPGSNLDASNLIGIGLGYSRMDMGPSDIRVQTTTVPLSYTIRNDLDPRRQLTFRMPLSITDVGGAKVYNFGLGVSYRVPMSRDWALTPSFNYALTGSSDLGSAAQVASAGITSTYYWRRDGYDLGMGNMLGYMTTMPFTYKGYSYDPNISNTVLRNGLLYSQPTRMLGGKMHFEVSLIDTRFFGSNLYSDNYQELKFTLGTTRAANLGATGVFRVGASLIHTPNDNGFGLEFGYWF